MTTTPVPAARHRTRKMHVLGMWNVEGQEIKGLWYHVGIVWSSVAGAYWQAYHHGKPLGSFPTKRAAVQVVVAAEAAGES